MKHFLENSGLGTTMFLDADHRQWLWHGSNSTGVRAATLPDAEAGQWIHLDRSDGLPSASANQQSFFEDTDGSVWWAADDTITHFTPPPDFATPKFAPRVYLSGYSWRGQAPRLAETVSDVPWGKAAVALIGSLQFDRRNAMQVRYRFDTGQAGWSEAGGFRIPLGQLPWGDHTLELQARVGTGPWSSTVSNRLTIRPPFWFSWPALFALILSTGGLAALMRWRERRKRRLRDLVLPDLAEWRVAAIAPEVQEVMGGILHERYQPVRLVARGGFGSVIEVVDLVEDRRCALKVFRRELEGKWLDRRFQQEVAALASFSHPNIVPIYGHGVTPAGVPYLVMEFVQGQTLRALLASGALPPMFTASLLRQAGSALAHIHSRGIYHRDVKPDNLIIRETGELVLIDFSIAIVKDPDLSLHGLSRAAGTFHYMAPEQAVGSASPRSDIYSLAKVTLEMMSGHPVSALFPDASLDLPERVREYLAANWPALSRDSVNLLVTALEFDPARQPDDAASFANGIAADLDISSAPQGGPSASSALSPAGVAPSPSSNP